MSNLLTTPVCRVNHVAVFKAVNSPRAKDRYKKKLTIMLAKGYEPHELFKAQYLRELQGLVQPGMDFRAAAFKDGDLPMKQGKRAGQVDEVAKGHWLLTPWADPDADLVLRYLDEDGNAQPAMSGSHIYSGCWARVTMRLFAYTKGAPGITVGLAGVLRIADGKRLGNQVSEDDVLESMGLGTPAPAPLTSNGQAALGRLHPEITDPAIRASLGI